MLLRNVAIELVDRLFGLDKFPKTEAAVDELVKAMIRAENFATARDFVENWLENNRKAPYPCDIYQALDPRREVYDMRRAFENFPPLPLGQDAPPPEYFCNQCEDSGWYIVPMRQRIPETGEPYMGAKKCPHPVSYRGALAKPK